MASMINNASKIYSIEGNIGSGKSTIIKILKEHFKSNDNIIFLLEPVDEWNTICDNDKTILEKYYENKKQYAFSFQMMAYISRLSQLKEALKKGYNYIITERSIATDKNVFAKMLYDTDKIDEINYKIYLTWFDEFINEIPEFQYIYIKTTPYKALERINKRSRKGESIPIEYLKKCDLYHDEWLKNTNVNNLIILDGNIDKTNNDDYFDWFNIIDKLIDF